MYDFFTIHVSQLFYFVSNNINPLSDGMFDLFSPAVNECDEGTPCQCKRSESETRWPCDMAVCEDVRQGFLCHCDPGFNLINDVTCEGE